jgi:predicted site-specific integrase-resolvase
MGVTAVDMPLVKIGKAAELLGVSVQTLREGDVRYYDMGKILGLGSEDMPIIGYVRVSSHDQKNESIKVWRIREQRRPR